MELGSTRRAVWCCSLAVVCGAIAWWALEGADPNEKVQEFGAIIAGFGGSWALMKVIDRAAAAQVWRRWLPGRVWRQPTDG